MEKLEVIRELDYRYLGGIAVTLFWQGGSNVTWVDYADEYTGEAFKVLVPEGTNPYDVFKHPNVYRA